MPSKRYIPAIDGIRALAVFGVLAFHFGVPLLDGGFVGVDVFFVISGFVIFRSIQGEMDKTGGFSWANFTLRRIRRLAPAALAVIGVTGIMGWLILDSVDFRLFSQSALSHLFCGSNIFFAETMGYFSGAAELYPLLHTWSLSVEEQFYIFVPILVIVICRISGGWKQKRLVVALWSLAIISFVACLIICNNSPSHGFYLSVTRAWEFCAGAILAMKGQEAFEKNPRLGKMLTWCGIIMVAVSFILMKEAKYPKAMALLPVGGTVFLVGGISFVENQFLNRLFSLSWVTWLGRLSYSLYLWHWPLLSLKYHFLIDSSIRTRFAIFGLGFLFAIGSYYFIEKPFRFRFSKRSSVKAIFSIWVVLLMGTAAVSFGLTGTEAEESELEYRRDVDWYGQEFRGTNIEIGAKGKAVDFVIWGDSHSGMISGVVDRLGSENDLVGRAFISDTTIPIIGHRQIITKRAYFNQSAFSTIVAEKPRFCLLVSSWNAYIDDDTVIESRRLLLEMVNSLSEQGITTIVMRRIPEGLPVGNARNVLVSKHFPRFNQIVNYGISLKEYESGRHLENQFLDNVGGIIEVLDPKNIFFENNKKRVKIFGDRAYYRDYGHLSFSGAEEYIPQLLQPVFERFAREKQEEDSRLVPYK